MQAQLFEGFQIELAAINKTLASERAALEATEDGEERGISKHKIAAFETLLATVKKSLDGLVAAEMESEEAPKKYRRWREAVAKALQAKLAMNGFEKPITELQTQVDQAENSYQNAQPALSDHRRNPVPNSDYADRGVFKKWETRCEEVQRALNERSAELHALKEEIALLSRDWLRASDLFAACAQSERYLKPRTPERPAEGFGILSAVS